MYITMEHFGLKCLIFTIVLIQSSDGKTVTDEFLIAGLFTTDISADDVTRETYGVYPLEAAKMAIEHVRMEGFLAQHDYKLILHAMETVCDEAGGLIATMKFFNEVIGERETIRLYS